MIPLLKQPEIEKQDTATKIMNWIIWGDARGYGFSDGKYRSEKDQEILDEANRLIANDKAQS